MIEGDCSHDNLGPVRDSFVKALKDSNRIELDLSGVDLIDGAFVGLCQLLLKHTRCSDGQLIISGASSRLKRIFYWNCANYLLQT
jgi:N-acetylglucosaminyldiphosphoundecaprenol N-acetyl-beta-D-mannosaminyltransferase